LDAAIEMLYSKYVAARALRQQRVLYRWTIARQATWLTLLTASYLFFYLLDVLAECFRLTGQVL